MFELRVALRRLRRAPGFTLPAAFCLALGLGSVITILAALDGLFFRPVPGLERPGELVTLHFDGPASVPNLGDLRDAVSTLSGIGSFTANLSTLRAGEAGERVLATAAAAESSPFLGRAPLSVASSVWRRTALRGAHPLAVVSHDYWVRRLGSDPGALRRTVWLNGTALTLVGVAPPGFLGTFTGSPVDIWVPLSVASVVSAGFDAGDRAGSGLELIARLAPGASLSSTTAALRTAAARLETAYPQVNRGLRIEVRDHTGFDEEIRMPVLLLAGFFSPSQRSCC